MGKCNCEDCSCREARDENTCDECLESHYRETNVEKLVKIAFSLIFFWYTLLLTILTKKKIEKEITKHPDVFIKALFEAMLNGT